MAKIKVYNNDTNRMETFYRGEQEAIGFLTVNFEKNCCKY